MNHNGILLEGYEALVNDIRLALGALTVLMIFVLVVQLGTIYRIRKMEKKVNELE